MTIKKRGRPAGSKNKSKALEKEIANWDAEPREKEVNWQELANKLQNALAKSYADYQDLQKDVEWATKQCDVLEAQLELRQRHINFLELDIAHRVAKAEGIFRDEDADSSI